MKKIMAVVGVGALTFAMASTAFAGNEVQYGGAVNPIPAVNTVYQETSVNETPSKEGQVNAYGLMFDSNGNLLSPEAFEAKLDQAIQDGSITPQEKDSFLRMYEQRCASNGSGAGRGCGMGGNFGWNN